MKKLQLFEFETSEIRTLADENGNPWLVAKDVCAVLGYSKYRDAIASRTDADERMSIKLDTLGGKQSMTFINESGFYALVFGSSKPNAKAFRKFVTSTVLPALRKTGTYSLKASLLPAPRQWEKTFPAEFMRNVLKLYGYKYDAKKGTPSFIGHFINEYVYNTLDKGLSKALKSARATFAGDDEVAFLHQFLADPAREALQNHIMVLNGLAAGSATIDGFKQLYERAFTHRNQLEMYLR